MDSGWLHKERRKHVASVFHAVALGALGVFGFNALQHQKYWQFALIMAAFIVLEFIALAFIPRNDNGSADNHIAGAHGRNAGAA